MATIYLKVSSNVNPLLNHFNDDQDSEFDMKSGFLGRLTKKMATKGMLYHQTTVKEGTQNIQTQTELGWTGQTTDLPPLEMQNMMTNMQTMVESIGPLVDFYEICVAIIAIKSKRETLLFLLFSTVVILNWEYCIPAAMVGLAVGIMYISYA